MPDPVLSVRGNQIVDGAGQPVILRGYNIGGWMNMENFLTGYPGTESQHRRVLRRVLGPELYDAFVDRFMSVFFDDADARYLASLGLNLVRIPWAYKDVGGQGLVSAAPDSPWRERIRDVMAKKARLGVDHWGSLDTEIRHIMTPIEETFSKEYPGFDPFPFGQMNQIMTLVRNILLAEPMLDDFGRCFTDVTRAETARELADSFRLENCVVRERLAGILSAAARQPS